MNRKPGAWVLVYSVLMLLVLGVGLIVGSAPTRIDQSVMNAIEPLRSGPLISAVSTISAMMSPVLVPVWALGIAVFLLLRDRRITRAVTVLGAVVGAAAVAEVIKVVVARPRPPAADQVGGAVETTLSYPSGHVTGTAALLVAVALVGTVAGSTRRLVALALALALAVTIAGTRLYLGVHWFTDVSAGVVVGAASAVFAAAVVPGVIDWVARQLAGRVPERTATWLGTRRTVDIVDAAQ